MHYLARFLRDKDLISIYVHKTGTTLMKLNVVVHAMQIYEALP